MALNRAGSLSADIKTTGGVLEFRVTDGLEYFERSGLHCIIASNGQGKEFYVYLPLAIASGRYSLGLSERSPMIFHVTGNSESDVHRGSLELTVGGDAQFAGSFSGMDADGLEVENGTFMLEYHAVA